MTKSKPFIKASLLFLSAILLAACGTAHVRTEKHTSDLHDYSYIYIDKVDIHSQESTAASNDKLQSNMAEWERLTRKELENYFKDSKYIISESYNGKSSDTLVVDLDIDLAYGNRALRYFVGFGAGKGSVNSVLKVVDPLSGDTKFHAVAESDLALGGFGGDMQAVLKGNIKKLIQKYPKYSSNPNMQ